MTDTRDYLRALGRWKWLILAVSLVCAATATLVSYQLPKSYSSTAEALVSPKQVVNSSAITDSAQLPNVDQLVLTYTSLVDTAPVRQGLVDAGVPRSADQLRGHLVATRVPNTTLISVTATDSDPQVALLEAKLVTTEVNKSLSELQARVPESNQNSHLDALVPWEVPTQPAATPISPNIPLNTVIAVVVGLLLAGGLAFLFESLDATIKTDADVRLKLGLPLLGLIVDRPIEKSQGAAGAELGVISAAGGTGPFSEQFRSLRTNIMFSRVDQKLTTIVMTSTLPGEGKTTTACNLAVVMAQAGYKVVLIDADLRRPALQRVFRRQGNEGVGNLVLGEGSLSRFVLETEVPNLRVLCSGPIPPNPSELLGSATMQSIIAKVKSTADLLIFDTPPIGAFTDATVLGATVDAVVLVVERGRTPIRDIRLSIETLAGVGVTPLGVVLNRAQVDPDYYYYGYYSEDASSPSAEGELGAPFGTGQAKAAG
jgi:capsular exopolysaccharide synthesis family protein